MQYELRVDGQGVTDVGKVRSKNEDSLLILDDQRVYLVADGMGGVSGGEIASQKVVECIREQIGRLNASVSLNDKMLSIHEAVVEANQWILGWSEKNEVQGAGTTLVLLALSNEYPWAVNILHAGDSRAYRYRAGQLQQITSDHSIEEAVGDNSGQPLPSQFKGLITNAVGLKKSLALDLTHADQMTGDIWLLCSDGLDKMLSDDAIASILASDGDSEANAIAQRLVNEANAAGGKDNVSVVIVKVLACSERPAEAPEVPFPGPLPSMPEEDDPASETSMTDTMSVDTATNGSVMMSLETPDSETDFVSKKSHSGIKNIIRGILLGIVGVLVVILLLKLMSGGDETVSTEVKSSVSNGVAGPETAMESTLPMEEVVARAKQSGDWEWAYIMTQKGSYSQTDANKKLINIWYNLAWSEASGDPEEAKSTLSEFIAAADQVLSDINRDPLPSVEPWPGDSVRIANEFCRRRYDLQQTLTRELREYRAINSDRVSFMQGLPNEQLIVAFEIAGLDRRKYKDFARVVRNAEYALQELERWLDLRISQPIPTEQLKSLPDSHLKHCDKADFAVNQLVEVLRVKPEMKNVSDKELKQAQLEWRSIQEILTKLNSGMVSAEEQEALRQYLTGLSGL
ncbi:protein phosphatase 2C domain-containing protein [Pontiellaceae bacterium B12227]|nr:protein phosphatase 2C domain-containing protein [Pontiellaceae bacterium B12227]